MTEPDADEDGHRFSATCYHRPDGMVRPSFRKGRRVRRGAHHGGQ